MTMIRLACAALLTATALPALAQDRGEPGVTTDAPPESVFDGDYLTVGIGLGYGATYSGSDDYTTFVLPLVQGSLGGVDFSPRPAGIAADIIPDPADGPSFSFGPVVKLNSDRTDAEDIDDEVVALYGELDRAVEVGASAGVTFPEVLHGYDSVSFNVDAVWDVAGAHEGMTVSPSVSYFTPLSRGTAASLTLSTTWVDDDFADYYYSVPTAPGGFPAGVTPLAPFEAESGLESAGMNLFLAQDLDGDITNGGLALVGIAGYSRLLGDAADTPFTEDRGSANQFLAGIGIGYTF